MDNGCRLYGLGNRVIPFPTVSASGIICIQVELKEFFGKDVEDGVGLVRDDFIYHDLWMK
jgi:hypothetical protein